MLKPNGLVTPSIAQLVERRTVEALSGILRSLVQLRLEGESFKGKKLNLGIEAQARLVVHISLRGC